MGRARGHGSAVQGFSGSTVITWRGFGFCSDPSEHGGQGQACGSDGPKEIPMFIEGAADGHGLPGVLPELRGGVPLIRGEQARCRKQA